MSGVAVVIDTCPASVRSEGCNDVVERPALHVIWQAEGLDGICEVLLLPCTVRCAN